MSDFITGREIVLAVKKGAAWRTAVTVGADDGVLILSESLGEKAPNYLPDDSLGQADVRDYYKMSEAITGAGVDGYLRYEGWDTLIALAFGTSGTPSQEEATAYSNTYSPADNIDGYFATLAMKKANTTRGIWEVPSAKISGITIESNITELARINIGILGNKIETVSPTNDTTAIGNVTYPTRHNLAKMDTRFKIRMNAQAGGALSDSDKIYPSGFTVVYNRPFAENYEASYIDMSEPVQDNFPEATIELRFDKYNLDTFLDAIDASTEYKMDILFEGDIISGSTRYTFRIDLPKIVFLSGGAPVGGPGTIPHTVSGRLLAVDSAPTGMTGVTDPLSVYVINTRQTDPLA